MEFKGNTWKFGNDIDTDAIIPARYLNTSDPAELAKHCMEDADANFAEKVAKGDIIVAEKNFGCGSSREHAPIAIKEVGVSCVIAKSFARIFYRNAVNIGLPIFESPEAVAGITEGDQVEVLADKGIIRNLNTGKEYTFKALPEFMQQLMENGGLMHYVAERMKKNV